MKIYQHNELTKERNTKEVEKDFRLWLYFEIGMLSLPFVIAAISFFAEYIDGNPMWFVVCPALLALMVGVYFWKKKF
jgi:L-asparagine transporter-like permease